MRIITIKKEVEDSELLRSCKKFGYEVTILEPEPRKWWPCIYNEIKKYPDERFLYLDYQNAFFQLPLGEIPEQDFILTAAEKICMPFHALYPKFCSPSRWRYPGICGFTGKGDLLADYFERTGLNVRETDYFTAAWVDAYLRGKKKMYLKIKLDYRCRLFQSVSSIEEGDFKTVRGIIRNMIHKSFPQIITNEEFGIIRTRKASLWKNNIWQNPNAVQRKRKNKKRHIP